MRSPLARQRGQKSAHCGAEADAGNVHLHRRAVYIWSRGAFWSRCVCRNGFATHADSPGLRGSSHCSPYRRRGPWPDASRSRQVHSLFCMRWNSPAPAHPAHGRPSADDLRLRPTTSDGEGRDSRHRLLQLIQLLRREAVLAPLLVPCRVQVVAKDPARHRCARPRPPRAPPAHGPGR